MPLLLQKRSGSLLDTLANPLEGSCANEIVYKGENMERLWKKTDFPLMIVVATCGTISNMGELYMLDGQAASAVKRIQGLPIRCADAIKADTKAGRVSGIQNLWIYGFVCVQEPTLERAGFGLFQNRFSANAWVESSLVSLSAKMLVQWANDHKDVNIRLEYPGDKRCDAKSIMETLPERVVVCI